MALPAVSAGLRHPPLKRCVRAVALACGLFAAFPGSAQNAPNVGEALNQLGNSLGGLFRRPADAAGVPGQLVPAQAAPNSPAGAAAAALGATAAPAGPPMSASHRALFAKGTVNGEDLYETLKAMRLEMRAKRSAAAWSKLSLAVDQTMTAQALGGGGLDIGRTLQSVGSSAVLELMKGVVANVAMKTLDDYLQYLLDERRTALAEETITLPNTQGMTEPQARRVVTMATLIVAARVSDKVLGKANEDFKSLVTDYKTLIEQREKAAGVMFATIDQRRAAQRANDDTQKQAAETDLKRSLSEKDISFIDQALNRMTLAEFSKDMAAQNLALEYLRSKDPAAFGDYRIKADEVVRRTSAYVRTVSGVMAFGGLMASFGHSIAEIAKENNLNNLLTALPLGGEFLTAAAPLAKKAVEVSFTGVTMPVQSTLEIFNRRKLFTVLRADKSEELRGASDVFDAMAKAGATDQFVGALFLGDSAGWLNRVRFCDPVEAGRMIDAAVPQAKRSTFATEYFAWTDADRVKDFNFMNAFSEPGANRRERELGDELLGRDHRKRSDSIPLANMQLAVGENFKGWSNEQLLRMVFHNREGGAAYATLDLGDFSIRPVPSPEAVYAYESRVEACRKIADQAAGVSAPAEAAATSSSAGSTAATSSANTGSATPPASNRRPAQQTNRTNQRPAGNASGNAR